MPRAPQAPAPRVEVLRGPLVDLAADLGIAVCLSEVQGSSIVVVESIGAGSGSPPLSPGLRLPFVAPFGREFVAWAPVAARRDWLAAAGPVNRKFRTRISLVLDIIRRRGYGVERLSDELNRVVTALLALDGGRGSDAISARLAGALADLTVVDVLGEEATSGPAVAVATVSAPIRDSSGAVALTVSAQPYRELATDAIDRLGAQVQAFAGRASDLLGSGPGEREPRRTSLRAHA
ncbi:transcriptional regulator [[Mycobacterium] wendilense]|uniref:Transcriptional regulator n=1 Tax=[Mycobacterium] wendilense TaxID=3064284 RepID=A0ABM9MKI8_9MYCO|nr:transcriptional regulator [Mycolicibacterium sp. MU0050]CAJ1587313.1 transcriptional regulator [Mycolicibacterium sp. MU0050]